MGAFLLRPARSLPCSVLRQGAEDTCTDKAVIWQRTEAIRLFDRRTFPRRPRTRARRLGVALRRLSRAAWRLAEFAGAFSNEGCRLLAQPNALNYQKQKEEDHDRQQKHHEPAQILLVFFPLFLVVVPGSTYPPFHAPLT
jgi:hypothetical protein